MSVTSHNLYIFLALLISGFAAADDSIAQWAEDLPNGEFYRTASFNMEIGYERCSTGSGCRTGIEQRRKILELKREGNELRLYYDALKNSYQILDPTDRNGCFNIYNHKDLSTSDFERRSIEWFSICLRERQMVSFGGWNFSDVGKNRKTGYHFSHVLDQRKNLGENPTQWK